MSYITTKDIIRVSGIGTVVTGEVMTLTEGSSDSYDLKRRNLIADTYSLYYALEGSNDFTSLTLTTDYSINLDRGTVLLTAAGIAKVVGKVLYIDYTSSKDVSDSSLAEFVLDAESEVESLTGNYWGAAKDTEVTMDGREQPIYPYTNRPYVSSENNQDFLQLRNKGVRSINSIEFVPDGDGDNQEIESTSYRFDENGKIIFINIKLPLGLQNVIINYNHGYTDEQRPREVNKLASYLAAINVLVSFSGGSYDAATSFTVGRKSTTIGEQYVNIREVLSQLKDKVNRILKKLGEDLYVC